MQLVDATITVIGLHFKQTLRVEKGISLIHFMDQVQLKTARSKAIFKYSLESGSDDRIDYLGVYYKNKVKSLKSSGVVYPAGLYEFYDKEDFSADSYQVWQYYLEAADGRKLSGGGGIVPLGSNPYKIQGGEVLTWRIITIIAKGRYMPPKSKMAGPRLS
jgi:hypothetical protein